MARETRERSVSVAGRIEPQINRYYLKISRRYTALGIFLMLLLFFYVVCVLTFFGEYVTADNLKYLAKDFETIGVWGGGDFTDIVYNGSEDMRFGLFRNGLAAADGDDFRYYDASGIRLMEEDTGYSDPAMVSSARYLLLYDIGGEGYSVYNQLTRIISRKAEGKLIAGDIADDGTMVLAMRSRETRFEVRAYNAAFTNTMVIYKENYVLDTAISPDGEVIVICSAITADTDFNCEVELCRGGESLVKLTYEHTMPLKLYAGEEGFILLCDNGVYFYNYEGKMTAGYPFSGIRLRYADLGDGGAAIVGSTNALGSENRLLVYGSDGALLHDQVLARRITGVSASRDMGEVLAYLTTPNSVLQVTAEGKVNEHIPDGGDVLAVVPLGTGALICRNSGAYPVLFED